MFLRKKFVVIKTQGLYYNSLIFLFNLFDISHMGRLQLLGPDAERFLDAMVTRRIADMKPGQVRYALVCNDAGGILDDVLVYRLSTDSTPASDEAPTYQVVVNASNRAKIVDWFTSRLTENSTRLRDVTRETAMIAIQGPRAVEVTSRLFRANVDQLKRYRAVITEQFGKVSGIAKGAKRSQRRFGGTLEPFVKVRLAFRERPRSDLAFIERWKKREG